MNTTFEFFTENTLYHRIVIGGDKIQIQIRLLNDNSDSPLSLSSLFLTCLPPNKQLLEQRHNLSSLFTCLNSWTSSFSSSSSSTVCSILIVQITNCCYCHCSLLSAQVFSVNHILSSLVQFKLILT